MFVLLIVFLTPCCALLCNRRTWALRPGAVASSTVFSEEGEGPEEGLALSVLVGLGRAASTVPATQRSKWVQRLLEFCDTALSARQALTTCGNTLVVLSVTLKLWRLGSACSSTTALFWEDAAPPSLRCASASTPLAQACVLLESLPEELRVARTEGWVEEDGLSRISQVHRSLLQLPPTRLSPLDSSLLRRVLPFIQ